MLVLEVLRYAAAPEHPDAGERIVSALESAGHGEVQWAVDAGLGPLLYRATRSAPDRVPVELRDVLLSADLTARVLQGTRIDTAEELIDACTGMGVPVTLLKGISISEQCYPSPHLRPMTDIDLLVPEGAFADVEAEALRRGYWQGPSMMGLNPHHGEPLYDPERQTKVEIHTDLFQQDSRLRRGELFSRAHIASESVATIFHGRPVHRLGDELQLVYVASYWIRDLTAQAIHPSLVAPLLDAVALLRVSGRTLDWDRLLSSLDNDMAAAALYIMLAWLARHDLAEPPSEILTALRDRQQLLARPELRVIDWLIDNYLVGGRPFTLFNSWHLWLNLLEPGSHIAKIALLPWHIAFPPSYPHRFNPRAQAARLARLLKRFV